MKNRKKRGRIQGVSYGGLQGENEVEKKGARRRRRVWEKLRGHRG